MRIFSPPARLHKETHALHSAQARPIPTHESYAKAAKPINNLLLQYQLSEKVTIKSFLQPPTYPDSILTRKKKPILRRTKIFFLVY